jgi:hypothetical protein
MLVHICNPSTREAEARGRGVENQPGLHSEFKASLGYIVGPCFQNKQTKRWLGQRKASSQSDPIRDTIKQTPELIPD